MFAGLTFKLSNLLGLTFQPSNLVGPYTRKVVKVTPKIVGKLDCWKAGKLESWKVRPTKVVSLENEAQTGW